MSEALYMMEIEQVLEEVYLAACQDRHMGRLEEVKKEAIKTLTHHYGLNLDDAQSEVAAAAGEEP